MTRHPAVFSANVLQLMASVVPSGSLVLDPFAGTGKLATIASDFNAVCVELEYEWAVTPRAEPGKRQSQRWWPDRTIQGNALHLPFAPATFDAIVTSPVFGNRMSDSHDAKDGSDRRSYRHDLGRKLHADNAGWMQWTNPRYRTFHLSAWLEVLRTLKSGGIFVVELKDHYRNRVLQHVVQWHLAVLQGYGCKMHWTCNVPVPGNRKGANRERVEHSVVALLRKEG